MTLALVPSLRHELLAYAVPRYQRSRDLDTADLERARLESWHAGLDRSLPTDLVPGFDRRYELATTVLDGPTPFPVHVVRPRSHRPRTTLYYVHGGGFVSPADRFHVRYALRLAKLLDAEVVLPDYPLAPEHSWRDSYQPLLEDLGVRCAIRDRVVVAGDSAGGGLALALAQGLRDAGGQQPSQLVLHAPWVDLTTSTPDTWVLDDEDPWLRLSKMLVYAGWWAGDPADLERPEVSPAYGDLSGLPPTLMFCGTRDLLVPGCRMLADRAAAAGWPLTYCEVSGLIHVFALLPGIPEAGRAWRQTRRFLA